MSHREITAVQQVQADTLAAAKFYARATAWRAIHGVIPEPDLDADEKNWQKSVESVREHCLAMVLAIVLTAGLAREAKRNPFIHQENCPSHDGEECRCGAALYKSSLY